MEATQPANDAALVAAALAEGAEAFAPIVERYKHAVFAVALARVRRFHDAEDAAQQTFVRAYGGLSQLTEPQRLGSWLRAIAIRCALDVVDSRRETVALDEIAEPASAEPTPEDLLEAAERRRMVLEAVARLPRAQRETVTLHYLGGNPIRQIAALVDAPEGTVKRRLHDARKRLKEEVLAMVEEVLQEGVPDEGFTERVFGLLNAYPDKRNMWSSEIEAELARLGSDSVDGFARALDSPHWQTRRAAVSYLDALPVTDQVIALLRKALQDSNKKVRKFALGTVPELDMEDVRKCREFAPQVNRMLFDPSRQVRRELTALWADCYLPFLSTVKVADALSAEQHPQIKEQLQTLLIRLVRDRSID
jgi:RNA polymerase sigma-70 factor, ECF subfamily